MGKVFLASPASRSFSFPSISLFRIVTHFRSVLGSWCSCCLSSFLAEELSSLACYQISSCSTGSLAHSSGPSGSWLWYGCQRTVTVLRAPFCELLDKRTVPCSAGTRIQVTTSEKVPRVSTLVTEKSLVFTRAQGCTIPDSGWSSWKTQAAPAFHSPFPFHQRQVTMQILCFFPGTL